VHSQFPYRLSLIMTHSPSVPAAARAVASSSARFQPVAAESRCPRGARRWLHAALAIVLLGSSFRASTAQGTWSTAQLSVAREYPAATSVGNVAIFAGRSTSNCRLTLFVEGLLFGLMRVGDGVRFACFVVCGLLLCCVCGAGGCRLMRVTAGDGSLNAVDLYNLASGTWSTAQLSVARSNLAATSVGNVAIFAGGFSFSGNCRLTLFVEGLLFGLMRVGDGVRFACFEACGLLLCCVCCAGGCRLMGVTAGSGSSNAVDLYNGASGTWSTAQLSVARGYLAATSVGNVAIFAGGHTGDCRLTLFC
jgi:hypothetical protein